MTSPYPTKYYTTTTLAFAFSACACVRVTFGITCLTYDYDDVSCHTLSGLSLAAAVCGFMKSSYSGRSPRRHVPLSSCALCTQTKFPITYFPPMLTISNLGNGTRPTQPHCKTLCRLLFAFAFGFCYLPPGKLNFLLEQKLVRSSKAQKMMEYLFGAK